MADFFPRDYDAARANFRAAATRLGARLESVSIDARGPQQQALSMDIAFLGAADAEHAVVVTIGLHGVEAFFGSAVQQAWLQAQLGRELPARCRVVLVHALNPYGFAWVRRTDENNVDLNRNYLTAEEEYCGAPDGYRRLDAFLNPRQPPRRFDPFRWNALLLIARYGLKSLKEAVAIGQYEFPQGIFYGGSGPSQTTRIVQSEFRRWVGAARHITHIDFHSGLGKFATHKLLTVEPAESARLERIRQRFGPAVESIDSGVAYPARGSLAVWLTRAFADRDFVSVAPEFGSHPITAVLAALRAENQAHFFTTPDDVRYQRAKNRLLEALCPASPRWRTKVVGDGLDIIDKAIRVA